MNTCPEIDKNYLIYAKIAYELYLTVSSVH